MLSQLAMHHESIEAEGGKVVGIGPAAPHQAADLMETTIPFDLYIDREQLVSKRVGAGRQSLSHFLFSLSAWWKYIRALLSGHWQRRITGHYSNVPAILVIDASGEVTYIHRGTGLGDYPPTTEVIDALKQSLDRLKES